MTKRNKLEAQWAEPVSLTFYSVLRTLYTEPYIDASYQISVHLAKWFQRRFLEIDQSETKIACGVNIFNESGIGTKCAICI